MTRTDQNYFHDKSKLHYLQAECIKCDRHLLPFISYSLVCHFKTQTLKKMHMNVILADDFVWA